MLKIKLLLEKQERLMSENKINEENEIYSINKNDIKLTQNTEVPPDDKINDLTKYNFHKNPTNLQSMGSNGYINNKNYSTKQHINNNTHGKINLKSDDFSDVIKCEDLESFDLKEKYQSKMKLCNFSGYLLNKNNFNVLNPKIEKITNNDKIINPEGKPKKIYASNRCINNYLYAKINSNSNLNSNDNHTNAISFSKDSNSNSQFGASNISSLFNNHNLNNNNNNSNNASQTNNNSKTKIIDQEKMNKNIIFSPEFTQKYLLNNINESQTCKKIFSEENEIQIKNKLQSDMLDASAIINKIFKSKKDSIDFSSTSFQMEKDFGSSKKCINSLTSVNNKNSNISHSNNSKIKQSDIVLNNKQLISPEQPNSDKINFVSILRDENKLCSSANKFSSEHNKEEPEYQPISKKNKVNSIENNKPLIKVFGRSFGSSVKEKINKLNNINNTELNLNQSNQFIFKKENSFSPIYKMRNNYTKNENDHETRKKISSSQDKNLIREPLKITNNNKNISLENKVKSTADQKTDGAEVLIESNEANKNYNQNFNSSLKFNNKKSFCYDDAKAVSKNAEKSKEKVSLNPVASSNATQNIPKKFSNTNNSRNKNNLLNKIRNKNMMISLIGKHEVEQNLINNLNNRKKMVDKKKNDLNKELNIYNPRSGEFVPVDSNTKNNVNLIKRNPQMINSRNKMKESQCETKISLNKKDITKSKIKPLSNILSSKTNYNSDHDYEEKENHRKSDSKHFHHKDKKKNFFSGKYYKKNNNINEKSKCNNKGENDTDKILEEIDNKFELNSQNGENSDYKRYTLLNNLNEKVETITQNNELFFRREDKQIYNNNYYLKNTNESFKKKNINNILRKRIPDEHVIKRLSNAREKKFFKKFDKQRNQSDQKNSDIKKISQKLDDVCNNLALFKIRSDSLRNSLNLENNNSNYHLRKESSDQDYLYSKNANLKLVVNDYNNSNKERNPFSNKLEEKFNTLRSSDPIGNTKLNLDSNYIKKVINIHR